MTQTGTLFSKTIKLYTRSPYNHVSIGFDKDLHEIYSFGRKKPRNPLTGGFVQESINKGVYKIYKDTRCRVYKIRVTDSEYIRLKKMVEFYNKCKDRYRYNLLGVIALIFGIPFKRKNHYFCTQFVARLLYRSRITDFGKDFSLVRPDDFFKIKRAILVYEGKLSEYIPA